MISKIVACDTETMGLIPYGSFEELGYYPDRPFAFSFTHYDGKDAYIRFQVDPFTRRVLYEDQPADFRMLKDFFADETITKVFHNAQFDQNMLKFAGLPCKGKVYDTMVLAHLADSSRKSFRLKPLAMAMFGFSEEDQADLQASVVSARRQGKKLGWKIATKETHGKEPVNADYAFGDQELCKLYAIGDTQRTMRLFKAHEPLLTEPQDPWSPYSNYAELAEREHALIPIAMEMSREGANLDMAKVAELKAYYTEALNTAKKTIVDLGYPDLNPSSPVQVIDVMYNQLGADKQYKVRKSKTTGAKTKTLTVDKKVLAGLSYRFPLAQALLEHSEAKKQLTGFIEPFERHSYLENGQKKIHPGLKTVGPINNRMACSNPNLQNISSPDSAGKMTNLKFRVRECFVPPPDHCLLLADYGQIEVFCTAYLSGDRVMIDALESGKKLHDITCVDVFKGVPGAPDWESKRRKAKITNFLLQYMGGPMQLSQTLGIPYEEAKVLSDRYWETYAGLADFYKRLEKAYKVDGFVKDLFGRPYRVQVAKDSYKLGNYVSSGTAAGMIKLAMVNLHRELEAKFPRSKLILQVHDELIQQTPNNVLCPELVDLTVRCMQGNFGEMLGMPGPLPVEPSIVRDNWGKKEHYCG